MDERKRDHTEPWDDGIFGTGRTDPPKSHGGIIAALLILIIFLSGIICALSILNIRLSRQLTTESGDEHLSISFTDSGNSVMDSSGAGADSKVNTDGPLNIELAPIPEGTSDETGSGILCWSEVYAKNIPSVVSISCNDTSGTGVILSSDGYIVTNCHVVENAEEIIVLLSDERVFHAKLIGADSISDLAVLYIDATDLVPAEFGDSSLIQVGDSVVAIGDPLGTELRGTMTDGIICAINHNVAIEGRTMTLIQTNAALDSGGPLINQHGQVIGINTTMISMYTGGTMVEGLGFAIPSATVKDIAEQLVTNGYVTGRPMLGLQGEMLDSFYRNYYRLPEGLYITSVTKGSPADQIGIISGDILISVDGVNVTTMDSLNTVLYSHQAGDRVQIVIYRSGQQITTMVTLAEDHG